MTTNVAYQEREGGAGSAGHASFRLDKVNQCAWLGTEPVSLSPKAFAVLVYLAERPGTLVTKQQLLDGVWPNVFVTEGVLKRAVLEIRKALSDSADEPRFIRTHHRRGYRFLVDNAPDAASSPSATAVGEQPPARRLLNVWHIVVGDGANALRDHSRPGPYFTPRHRWAAGLRARPLGSRSYCCAHGA